MPSYIKKVHGKTVQTACLYQPIILRMAAILRNSTVAVVVISTHPRAISLAMITMRKSFHGFPLVSYMGMGLCLAVLRAARALLLNVYVQVGKNVNY